MYGVALNTFSLINLLWTFGKIVSCWIFCGNEMGMLDGCFVVWQGGIKMDVESERANVTGKYERYQQRTVSDGRLVMDWYRCFCEPNTFHERTPTRCTPLRYRSFQHRLQSNTTLIHRTLKTPSQPHLYNVINKTFKTSTITKPINPLYYQYLFFFYIPLISYNLSLLINTPINNTSTVIATWSFND